LSDVPEEVLTDEGKRFSGRYGKPRPEAPLHGVPRTRLPTAIGIGWRSKKAFRAKTATSQPPLTRG